MISIASWISDHQKLFTFLRSQGLALGLDHEIRFVRFLSVAHDMDVAVSTPEDAIRWFSPLLSTSSLEQDRISTLIRAYHRQFVSPETPAIDDVVEFEAALTKKHRRELWRWFFVALSAVPLLSVVIFLSQGKQPTRTVPSPLPSQDPLNGNNPTTLVGEAVRWITGHGNMTLQLSTIASLLLIGSIVFLLYRRREIVLAKSVTSEELSTNVQLGSPAVQPYSSQVVLEAIRSLGLPRPVLSRTLDVTKSLTATLRAAGRIQLCFRKTGRAPEYVVLIERKTTEDHVANIGNVLVNCMSAQGVRVVGYYFDQDIESLRHADGQVARLGDVALRNSGARLFVVSDGRTLLGPDGDLSIGLLRATARFEVSVLLTPVRQLVWGRLEGVFALSGVRVSQLSSVAIVQLAQSWRNLDRGDFDPLGEQRAGPVSDVSGDMELDHPRWLADTPFSSNEQRSLGVSLRAWLGPKAFELLAAVAAFAEIRWEITLKVAELLNETDMISGADQPLLDMMRLPWFRHGRIPDWARASLLGAVPPRSAKRIRVIYRSILSDARISKRFRSIAIFAAGSRRPSLASHARERLVWDFMRNNDLEINVPRSFAQRIRRRLDKTEVVIIALTCVACMVVAIVLRPAPPLAEQTKVPILGIESTVVDSRDLPLTLDEQQRALQLQFGSTYGSIFPTVNFLYSDLLVASEIKGAEIRYIWFWVKDLPAWRDYLFSAKKCGAADSYVAWMFRDGGKLWRVSVRFFDYGKCDYSMALEKLREIQPIYGVETTEKRGSQVTVFEFTQGQP